jgi:hypothetical protein
VHGHQLSLTVTSLRRSHGTPASTKTLFPCGVDKSIVGPFEISYEREPWSAPKRQIVISNAVASRVVVVGDPAKKAGDGQIPPGLVGERKSGNWRTRCASFATTKKREKKESG